MSTRIYDCNAQTILEFLTTEFKFLDQLSTLDEVMNTDAFNNLMSKVIRPDDHVVQRLHGLAIKLKKNVESFLGLLRVNEPTIPNLKSALSSITCAEFCNRAADHIQKITKDLADWCAAYFNWQKIEAQLRSTKLESNFALCRSQLQEAGLQFPDFSSPFQRGPRYNLLVHAIIDDMRRFYESDANRSFGEEDEELLKYPQYQQFFTLYQCTQDLATGLNFQQGRKEFADSQNASKILQGDEVALAYSKGDDYGKGKSRDFLFSSVSVHEIRDDAGVFTSKVKTSIPYAFLSLILHNDPTPDGQDIGWIITNDLALDNATHYHPHIASAIEQLKEQGINGPTKSDLSVSQLLKSYKQSTDLAWVEVFTNFKGFQSNWETVSIPNALTTPRGIHFLRVNLARYPGLSLPQQEQAKSGRRRSLGGEQHRSNTNVMQILNNREDCKLDKMIVARFAGFYALVDLLAQALSVTPAPALVSGDKKHRRRLSLMSLGDDSNQRSAPSPTHSTAHSFSATDREEFSTYAASTSATPSSRRQSFAAVKRLSSDQPAANKRRSYEVTVPADDAPVQLEAVAQTPSSALKPVNALRLNNTTDQALAQSISTPSTTRRQVLPSTHQTLKAGVGNKYPTWRQQATAGKALERQTQHQAAAKAEEEADKADQCNQQ